MPTGKMALDKNLLPYWLLAAFALAHLLFLLSFVPAILPYVSDDVWLAWHGLHAPLGDIFRDNWISVLGMGRLALYMQYVLTDFAFRYPSMSYLWQSFPLFLSIVSSALFLGWYTQSTRLGLTLFILMGLGSFITSPHHLFAAYPASFTLGLTFNVAYIFAGLYRPYDRRFVPVRLVLFLFPLFIYEAFFPLQITAMLVIAARHGKWNHERTLMKKALNFCLLVRAELVALAIVIVAYAIVSHRTHGSIYQGTTLAHSYAAMPYTFIKYATGFLVLPMQAEALVLLVTVGWYAYALDKKQTPSALLATYFLVMWLAPPLLLSLTPKYQIWAQKSGELGSPAYVTTFLSETGCFGLMTLLFSTRGKMFQLLAVTLLVAFMWISWCDETARVIEQRLARFSALDAAIARKEKNHEENCFTLAETKILLLPWEYCEYEDSCRDVTPDILMQRGSRLCDIHGNNGH